MLASESDNFQAGGKIMTNSNDIDQIVHEILADMPHEG
jgi:hypothetical protein